MAQANAFPLSPHHTKHAIILLVAYGIIVIASAIAFALLSGDRSFPLHFILLLIITGVSVWGLRSGFRWAWILTTLFAAWQIYSGASILIFMNIAVINAPAPAKIVFGLLALRTVVLLVLFVLLLFLSDRQKIYS